MVENVLFEGGAAELLCGRGFGKLEYVGAEMRWMVRACVAWSGWVVER